MARFYRLTSLKIEGNNLLKYGGRGQLFACFCLGAGVQMDLKVTEGIIRTTQYKFMKKNPPPPQNIDFDFQPKIKNFLSAIVWRKKMAEMATASDVHILA